MKIESVVGTHEYDEKQLIKLHLRLRPVSSRGNLFFGLKYLTHNFDTAKSSLIDKSKAGKIKQKGLFVLAKVQVYVECGYSLAFKPTADEILKLLPPKYLDEQSGVVAYSVQYGIFDDFVEDFENPALVTLFGLKKGNKSKIQSTSILRNGKEITPQEQI